MRELVFRFHSRFLNCWYLPQWGTRFCWLQVHVSKAPFCCMLWRSQYRIKSKKLLVSDGSDSVYHRSPTLFAVLRIGTPSDSSEHCAFIHVIRSDCLILFPGCVGFLLLVISGPLCYGGAATTDAIFLGEPQGQATAYERIFWSEEIYNRVRFYFLWNLGLRRFWLALG